MRIIEIRNSDDKSTKYRNIIIFEDGTELLVSKSEIAEFGLFVDSNIGFENLNSLRTCILVRRAKTYALRLLTRMNLSSDQLTKKLRGEEYSEDIINEVKMWLEERDLINDEVFVENFITYNKKNKSKKQIMYKLMDKGIEKNLIIDKLETAEFDEIDEAVDIVRKRMRTVFINGEPDSMVLKTEKDKILGYLFRKGFTYDTCKKAVSIAIESLRDDNAI